MKEVLYIFLLKNNGLMLQNASKNKDIKAACTCELVKIKTSIEDRSMSQLTGESFEQTKNRTKAARKT